MTILKQTSPFEERVTRNGIQRDIHVVIKNSPFVVQMGVSRNCEIDLNHIAFEAALLYDTDGEKGVDFVKLKPIEYKCIPNEAGDQVSVELRIKVLTSQHEDMFFKVKIQGQDPVSKQEIPNLKVITAPIKVISKPEQLKKRQTGTGAPIQANTILPPTTVVPVPTPSTNNNPNITVTNSKKRTVNDLVIEAVTRIEKQQYEQANALDKIINYMAIPKQENSLNPNASWEFLPPLQKLSSSQRKDGDSFESSFGSLLKSFTTLDPNQRAEKVRRVARGLSLAENEALAEFVDMLMTEGLGIEAGREARPTASTLIPQHLDVKPNLYATHPMHHHHGIPTNLALSMSKNGDADNNFFFTSMLPNYTQVNVSVGNGEEAYPDFLAATTSPSLPLGNSADFLNM